MATPLAPGALPVPSYPPANRTGRKVVLIAVLAAVAILASAAVAMVLLLRSTAKYAVMDKSRESLSWDTAQDGLTSTTYSNPTYGLTLTLPGRWNHSRTPTKYLCHLVSEDGFHAIPEIDFPVLTPSVDADAEGVRKKYEMRNRWTFQGGESTQVSGLPAHILRLSTPRRSEVEMLFVKRWPVVYVVSIAGPDDATTSWQRVRQALPKALQIK